MDENPEAAPPLSLEELGPRVREVERLAALGCRLARESLADPEQAPRAQERIQSILQEVSELVPGFSVVGAPLDPHEFVAPSMASAATPSLDDAEAENQDEPSSAEDETEQPEDGEETEDDSERAWDLDPDKLAQALQNDALMSQIPEVDREWFKGLAHRVIESHARAVLATRVKEALAALHETMEHCREETSKRLSIALTFEQLRIQKAKKLD